MGAVSKRMLNRIEWVQKKLSEKKFITEKEIRKELKIGTSSYYGLMASLTYIEPIYEIETEEGILLTRIEGGIKMRMTDKEKTDLKKTKILVMPNKEKPYESTVEQFIEFYKATLLQCKIAIESGKMIKGCYIDII